MILLLYGATAAINKVVQRVEPKGHTNPKSSREQFMGLRSTSRRDVCTGKVGAFRIV